MELDGGFDLFGRESLLLREDHEVSCILHDLQEEFCQNVVDQCHTLFGDPELRLHLFQNSVDVGLERGWVQNLSWSGLLSGNLAGACS